MKGLLSCLERSGISYVVFDQIVANPTINKIEEGVKAFNLAGCEAIIAFGGGLPMDCGKAIGARIAQPKKSISQMKGLFKIRKNSIVNCCSNNGRDRR
ncbi:iron-containing alcohol dehydrogenase [endosymbiont 'TC1' of Trimyema compressum]|uniref:iron-containing alcohol dehydrogenase n=1 Tax=endosymbiont 'TC1' of Trimyema compressum TaxID=243899 RepID=UPI00316AEAF8